MMDRRMFLRSAGVLLALPAFEAFGRTPAPRRMVAIQTTQGIMPHFWFPEGEGEEYVATPYLDLLKEHRKDFTVFSGLSHPGVDGGHANEVCFLSAAPHPTGGAFRNTISLDQFAAERVGSATRFRSLVLDVRSGGSTGMSYTSAGVRIPAEGNPGKLYKKLFVQGNASDVEARLAELAQGKSLLDSVRDSAKRMSQPLGARDRERMDQYLTAVRELEGELATAADWAKKPKPKVSTPAPEEIPDTARLANRLKAMLDVVKLALMADTTRVISLYFEPLGVLSGIPGVKNETHMLTHHGNRPEMVDELRRIEEEQLRVLSSFLSGLRDASLLDRTMVLYGSCMGNANGHSNTNWPVLLAGGGFKHGRHLAFDRKRNTPLANLFVSMLQRLGVETDKFASGTATLKGLEPAG
jgi:hypothetical protein